MHNIFASDPNLSDVLDRMITVENRIALVPSDNLDRLAIAFRLETQYGWSPKQVYDHHIVPALRSLANEINKLGPIMTWMPRHKTCAASQKTYEGRIPVLVRVYDEARGYEMPSHTYVELEVQVRRA